MEKCKLCGGDGGREREEGFCPRCWKLYDLIKEEPELAVKALRMLSSPASAKIESEGWIGVDLDCTLAHYESWAGVDQIGAPIPLMVERVKGCLRRLIFCLQTWIHLTIGGRLRMSSRRGDFTN